MHSNVTVLSHNLIAEELPGTALTLRYDMAERSETDITLDCLARLRVRLGKASRRTRLTSWRPLRAKN